MIRLIVKSMMPQTESIGEACGVPANLVKSSGSLDEKYFRRMDKFEGWLFDLIVAMGQADGNLQKQIEGLTKQEVVKEVSLENWHPTRHVQKDIYDKYHVELYGVLVSLTSGEAKGILKGMLDSGIGADGFMALRGYFPSSFIRTLVSHLSA